MRNTIIKSLLLLVLLVSCQQTEKKEFTSNDINLIPKPEKLVLNKGSFSFNKNTKFVISAESQKTIANELVEKLNTVEGWNLQIVDKDGASTKNSVVFTVDSLLSKEGYKLDVSDDDIFISAKTNSGFFYGVQTLRQLLPVAIESNAKQESASWIVPNVNIEDQPRFPWRGLMLDVSRHFFDKAYIKQTIDRLAAHKMNVLHLHLIDDQGWRLEIKKYPKLTDVGAWRIDKEDLHWNTRDIKRENDTILYGGFYTQEDIKEIVAYAASKQIEVVPEIEMPAHVTSAIAAYPEFSCKGTPVEVPSGGIWPITDIYCAGKEETFQFLEDVLTEVIALFPSKYIHIGGDEATKINWKTCNECKARMHKEHLEDAEELQSYFIKRIEKFINANGKKLIGWDEILEGGLAPDATVMSWRGFDGGIKAAAEGHDVIMTPGDYCYVNLYQGPYDVEPIAQGGYLPLNKVYQFDPIVPTMTAGQAAHVLGGQANLWAEFVSTNSHSEYMIFPRLSAMAEVLWTPKEQKNWSDFSSRLMTMFKRYEHQNINYSKSSFLISDAVEVDLDAKTSSLTLQNEYSNSDIRYVLNNDDLATNAIPYTEPIVFDKTTIVQASLFQDDKPIGTLFNKTIKFHDAMAKKVNYLQKHHEEYAGAGIVNLVDGIRGTKNFFDGKWQGWLDQDMEVVIDMDAPTTVTIITVGALEDQGPDIFLPVKIEVSTSSDGVNFTKQASVGRAYKANSNTDLKEFQLNLTNEVQAQFIKVKAFILPKNPSPNRGVWLFIDEIIVN